MKRRGFLALLFILSASAALAANRSTLEWEEPRPIDPNTVFFGEKIREKVVLSEAPLPSDKKYPWYCLDKGNLHYLNREYDKSAVYFKAAFAIPGATRVMSGLRLIDAYQKLGWTELALETLNDLDDHYLGSTREFQEARRLRMELEDKKRRAAQPKKMPTMTGREWILKLQDWRYKYVLDAMEELRKHSIPFEEEVHAYVFYLDEYFTANPSVPADDAFKVLSDLVYERDEDARLAIDHWRINPEGTLTEEAKALERQKKKLSGMQWVTLVHQDKLDYVAEAMKVLRSQNVPLEKELYGYVSALDDLFTDKPELSASDSVKALASYLYENEPEARKVLEALRLE